MTGDVTQFYYMFPTVHGIISLLPEPGGRYKVMFKEDNLGSYHSAQAAAEDVAGGHVLSPISGVELNELGIPHDLEGWQKKVFAVFKGLRPA
ncbi:hypothetical protein [Frigidibacter sp.]|uniref:hypothetical protein n=1 Tax=Frigidibacter sp. TaxID=2586418 RepID=UPI002736FEB1|nr:hypothetical protein [Frigidibacter sp.]MDP3340314.1 hypothetical protein [Frigidibacter sp.]